MTGIEHYAALAEPYLREYGIAAVFVVVCLEAFGVPLPGETLVIASGLLASRGDMNIVLLVGAIWLAAVLGDNIGYAIGMFGGRRLVLQHGARVGITEPRLAKVEGFFRRYGGEIVLVARFFVGLRQLNGLIAGTVAMPWPRFLLYNAVGAALWTGVWGFGAYVLGHHMSAILPWFHRFGYAAIALAALAVVVLLAIRYARARRVK
jgi:membrane protein DedA with SNARE-associated domain